MSHDFVARLGGPSGSGYLTWQWDFLMVEGLTHIPSGWWAVDWSISVLHTTSSVNHLRLSHRKMDSGFQTQYERESTNSWPLRMHCIWENTVTKASHPGKPQFKEWASNRALPLAGESGKVVLLTDMRLGTGMTHSHFATYHILSGWVSRAFWWAFTWDMNILSSVLCISSPHLSKSLTSWSSN